MKIAFRTDASLQIGSGHVMRCLTLADALTAQGAQCHFISRAHPGHLLELIRQRGYKVNSLPAPVQHAQTAMKVDKSEDDTQAQPLAHAAWLGCDWETDALQTGAVLATLKPDWLITDHYALALPWEVALRPHYIKLMVIDDLADRAHICDVLLDQNWFGDETTNRYNARVPSHCIKLLGPKYALIKPEYTQLRQLMPPRDGIVRRVLVFMGGSDPSSQTAKVLHALSVSELMTLALDVVVGVNHPDPRGIQELVTARPATTLHQNLPCLAGLMARADLMIGAGGSTTWERMCLGLPAIVISVAANQTSTNIALMNAGYIDFLGEMNQVTVETIAQALQRCLSNPATLSIQSDLCQTLVDGDGTQVLSSVLLHSVTLGIAN